MDFLDEADDEPDAVAFHGCTVIAILSRKNIFENVVEEKVQKSLKSYLPTAPHLPGVLPW
jgi:hypothetical protein